MIDFQTENFQTNIEPNNIAKEKDTTQEFFGSLKKSFLKKIQNLKNAFEKLKIKNPGVDLGDEERDFLQLEKEAEQLLEETKKKLEESDSVSEKSEDQTEEKTPQILEALSPRDISGSLSEGERKSENSERDESISGEHLEKISDQLGSNEGGIYIDSKTGEKFYIKFYKNPDQGRLEKLANDIYTKLGIAVPKSEILIINGRLALASKFIDGLHRLAPEEIALDDSFKAGFVCDAFLANWDVIGLIFDNVEEGTDGRKYRIDNGGSFIFRAQGGIKSYHEDSIPELDSLRNPDINPTAGKVFEGLSEEEIKKQAQLLIDNLSEEEIDYMVDQVGLSSADLSEKLKKGLKGRRSFLIQRYGLKDRKKTEGAISERRRRNREILSEIVGTGIVKNKEEGDNEVVKSLFVRGISGDSDKVEGHQIDLIKDENILMINFKITSPMLKKVLEMVLPNVDQGIIEDSEYSFYDRQLNKVVMSDAWRIKLDGGVNIYISKGKKTLKANTILPDYDKPIYSQDGVSIIGYESKEISYVVSEREIRALLGSVIIEITQDLDNLDVLISRIESAFNLLSIDEPLDEPTPDALLKYKEARFRWQHKLETEDQFKAYRERYRQSHGVDILDCLERREVYPGYFTVVEPRSLDRYKEIGDFVLIHAVYNEENLPIILKTGLLSSHDRFKRGIFVSGMSTYDDFKSGGADNVFLRLIPLNWSYDCWRPMLVLKPEILERTDWYAYNDDLYGTTDPETFKNRPTPEEFIRQQITNFSSSNEIMMRRGIPPEMIDFIAVPNDYSRSQVLEILRKNGITEINGKKIEEFVKILPNFKEYNQ